MIILGIESSCDETGIGIYDTDKSKLLAHTIHSQIKLHAKYGGVVPELASRDHISRIIPLIELALKEANITLKDLGAIAVTKGPGLGGALLVGVSVANGLAYALDIPIIDIHHLEGHLLSPFLSDIDLDFPFLALLVSGGHTQILRANKIGDYHLLGESIDDAVGEAFDKVGKLLGLDYPAGPKVASMAKEGKISDISFPRPMINSKDLNMSFSGLKTSVLTTVLKLKEKYNNNIPDDIKNNICFAFQEAVVDVLLFKVKFAIEITNIKKLVVVGGVGANLRLREKFLELPIKVFFPDLKWCTDNGAMIAYAGSMHLKEAKKTKSFEVLPRWKLALK